jgi:hypothetical protein
MNERRFFPRHPYAGVVVCRALAADASRAVTATARNICTGGVSLKADCSYEPGTLLHLHLSSASGTVSFLKVVQVRYANPTGDGGWHLGAAFPHRFTREELRSLL